ncbi:hypothetical protein LINGRAPRIM_LOCUS2086 [Linum grandiflorum]
MKKQMMFSCNLNLFQVPDIPKVELVPYTSFLLIELGAGKYH